VSEATLQNISDTALWVATYRAWESERTDALFHDPYARRLAGPRGEQMVRSLPGGGSMSWAMVVRTVALDDIILRVTRDLGADTVLNLAAGLDARPWRLPLPPDLRWIDVDLPHMLDSKWRVLAGERARCRYEPRPIDLRETDARRALFADVGAGARRVMVVSEGLLIYLEPDQVASLTRDLAAVPSFHWWAFDLVGPEILARLQRQFGRALAGARAPFHFGPADGTSFFTSRGWREREFHSTIEDALRLRRPPPMGWLVRLIRWLSPRARREHMRRMAGNVLLERSDSLEAGAPAARVRA
jgi:methyltransferase (TIGR00027 family)